jgi:hypothetical protein
MPVLLVRDRAKPPKIHKLRGLMVYVGRDAGCALVLPNTAVSRRHVKLTREKGEWVLEDMDTPNGTNLNDQPVKRAVLEHRDEIRIGHFRLEYIKELELDEEGRRQLDRFFQHGHAPVQEGAATFVMTPELQKRLLAAEKAKSSLVLAEAMPGGQVWRPEGRDLRIGPGGDVPARQFLRSTPLAVLEWDGKGYRLRRLGFWGRVSRNGVRVSEFSSVGAGDELRIGDARLVLREEPY